MPVHKIESSNTILQVWLSSNKPIQINRADHTGTQDEIEKSVLEALQLAVDTVQERGDLAADDPDKTTDPKSEREFWEGTTFRSRSIKVNSVLWPRNEDCTVSLSRVF